MMSAWKRLRVGLLAALLAASFIGPAHAAITTDGATFRDPGTGATGAMQLITDTLLASPATNITFTSIPGTYKHLEIVGSFRTDYSSAIDVLQAQLNGDATADYNRQELIVNNATISASASTGTTALDLGAVPGAGTSVKKTAAITILWPDYASTTLTKSCTVANGYADATAANSELRVVSNSWGLSSAITSIKLFPANGTNFVAGTRATL
ncbi:MAG: hypothetical protein KGJ86_21430, partial [Chloroflexota bacterium]|nr:hypothetical protein [Chloroflexota bacterium]